MQATTGPSEDGGYVVQLTLPDHGVWPDDDRTRVYGPYPDQRHATAVGSAMTNYLNDALARNHLIEQRDLDEAQHFAETSAANAAAALARM